MSKTFIFTAAILTMAVALLGAAFYQSTAFTISGKVLSGNDPVAEARVRIQGESDFTLTDSSGRFLLSTTADSASFVGVTAGKKGFYNALQLSSVGDTAVTVEMTALPEGDDTTYTFFTPIYCSSCHGQLYLEWQDSKHAGAATNKMLRQMYDGTDTSGTGAIYPGFKLDYPDESGDCADCHAPGASVKNPGHTDLLDVLQTASVDTNGVFCDFCHKVADVEVNYHTGVDGAITVKRPSLSSSRDINFGQFDDVTTGWMGGSYNPVYAKSDYCSGCHQYKNRHDLLVDDTYDSWAVSSYAAAGIQCQDCHMKPWTDSTFVNGLGSIDAVARDPERIYNHKFVGSTEDFLKTAAQLQANLSLTEDTLQVETTIINATAGHKLPTGVSFRHMLLTVEASQNGQPLTQISGDTVLALGGVGDPAEGNFSGRPGKAFAMIIRDDANGISPAPNWTATSLEADNRIPADGEDISNYAFQYAGNEDVSVRIQLLYRAVYKPWADAKGWDMREFSMIDTTISMPLVAIPATPQTSPEQFILEQNYPNPFNGATTIEFDLPAAAVVTLQIYDIIGRHVETPYRASLSPGTHKFTWNATDAAGTPVASGVYYYRLRVGEQVQTRKMLLVN